MELGPVEGFISGVKEDRRNLHCGLSIFWPGHRTLNSGPLATQGTGEYAPAHRWSNAGGASWLASTLRHLLRLFARVVMSQVGTPAPAWARYASVIERGSHC